MDKHKSNRWFQSEHVDFSSTEKVDVEAGVLFGVILCQVGEAKGHGVHLEQSFIDDCQAYGLSNHSKLGMKSRFGHPSMSTETLGTELGRFRNFRVEGEQLKADLHLLDSANKSPNNPGLKDWMISMAQEDPAMIMCSIVFKPKYEYQYDGEGNRVNVYFNDSKGKWHRCRNQNGEVTKYDEKEKIYVELDQLHFCDIVDQGAATDKLFSEQFNDDKFSVIATQFLNENPKIDTFLKEHPEKLLEFISDRHEIKIPQEETNQKFSFWEQIKMRFSSNQPQELSNQSDNNNMNFEKSLSILEKEAPSATELAEVKAEITQFTGANEKFTSEEVKSQVEQAVADKDKELGDKDQEITSLKAKVEELGAESEPPAEASKSGNDDIDDSSEEFYSEADRELDKMLNNK